MTQIIPLCNAGAGQGVSEPTAVTDPGDKMKSLVKGMSESDMEMINSVYAAQQESSKITMNYTAQSQLLKTLKDTKANVVTTFRS